MIRFFDGGMGSMLNLAAGELPEKLKEFLLFIRDMQMQALNLLRLTPLALTRLNMIM